MALRKFTSIGILSMSVLISGCAGGLKVQVDVLDNRYVESIVQENKLRSEAIALMKGNYKQTSQFMADTHALVQYYSNIGCFGEAKRIIPQFMPDDQAAALIQMIDFQLADPSKLELASEVNQKLQNMHRHLTKWDHGVGTALNKQFGFIQMPEYRDRALPKPMLDLLYMRRAEFQVAKLERQLLINKGIDECNGLVGSLIRSIDPNAGNVIVKIKHATVTKATISQAKSERSILGGAQLLATQEGAFNVVKAPKQYWAKNYNRAFGRGIGGNTDTAIKVNGIADYTVKGFTFDGRATANMVRKLAGPTVGFAAALAGVPIDITQADGKSAATFDSGIVNNAETAIMKDAASVEAYTSAAKSIAGKILSFQTDLTSGTPQTKDRALAIVTATYNGNKSLLTNPGGD